MEPQEPRDERLKQYVEALLERNKLINLTGARNFEQAWKLHVEDCAALLRFNLPNPRLAIDLGSGNGFPGVFVAAQFPMTRVLLVERTGKKAQAIADLAKIAGLTNVEVASCDGRELARQFPEVEHRADLVTARAVGRLGQLVTITEGWLARGGRLVFWKSNRIADDELAEGFVAANRAKLAPLERLDYELPGFRGGCLMAWQRPAKPPSTLQPHASSSANLTAPKNPLDPPQANPQPKTGLQTETPPAPEIQPSPETNPQL